MRCIFIAFLAAASLFGQGEQFVIGKTTKEQALVLLGKPTNASDYGSLSTLAWSFFRDGKMNVTALVFNAKGVLTGKNIIGDLPPIVGAVPAAPTVAPAVVSGDQGTEAAAVKPALPSAAPAPQSYIRTRAIGKPESDASKQASAHPTGKEFVTLEPAEWVGERVLFVPRSLSTRHYGYQMMHPANNQNQFSLPYDDYVGKTAIIKKVTKGDIKDDVELVLEGSGEQLVADCFLGSLHGLIFLRDIDLAREKYLGKTLWLHHKEEMLTEDADGESTGGVPNKRFAKVVVKEIVTGRFEEASVRFIVETADGKEGFVDVQLSGTNVSNTLRDEGMFVKKFAEKDPRAQYAKWGKRVVDAIFAEEVFRGMTAEQARASWGLPESVNATKGGLGPP